MYINPIDGKIIAESNVIALKKEYFRKHGKPFPHFNYEDFPHGANQYLNSLKAALSDK